MQTQVTEKVSQGLSGFMRETKEFLILDNLVHYSEIVLLQKCYKELNIISFCVTRRFATEQRDFPLTYKKISFKKIIFQKLSILKTDSHAEKWGLSTKLSSPVSYVSYKGKLQVINNTYIVPLVFVITWTCQPIHLAPEKQHLVPQSSSPSWRILRLD